MGLIARTIRVIKAKFNKLLSGQENPVEQLELQYEELKEARRDFKSAVTDVIAQRKLLEKKRDNFQEDVEKHNEQARRAMKQDREDLARRALQKKKSKMKAVEDFTTQIDTLQQREDAMKEKLSEIENDLDQLRTDKEVMKARYNAADAVENMNERVAEGIGDYSVEETMQDIEQDIQQKESRAEAINTLDEETGDTLDDELDAMDVDAELDGELASLREELGEDVNTEHPTPEEEELEKELA